MSNKKSGYAYLKEKCAKLKSENMMLTDEVSKDALVYDEQFKKINELKKHEKSLKNELDSLKAHYDREFLDARNRIDWLLAAAPFWIKWAYARKFGK